MLFIPLSFPAELFSATLRVKVSIAWEIRDFSRAANMVLASTPDPELPPGSPLLDPLSVEVSSLSAFKSVIPPIVPEFVPMSVSKKKWYFVTKIVLTYREKKIF